MKKLLENFSFPTLLILAVLLGLAPFEPQPHLLEKTNMLISGNLSKPLDIFDLIFHSSPIILLMIKTIYFLSDKQKVKN